MDVDRDGVISIDEFRAAVEAMDVGLTDGQMETLIKSIDADKDGELDMQVLVMKTYLMLPIDHLSHIASLDCN